MGELLTLPVAEMARAVREREVSPVELLDAASARIDARNPALNAIVVDRRESAREAARAVEAALARREDPGPLAGVPCTVKECLELDDTPVTVGSRAFAGERSAGDAGAVARLRAAGAIPVGKTNVAELLAYYDSFNPVYGATRNPWSRERSPGGSSGGEAAAIATGMSALGLGSDIGGSVRFPAHLCGIAALKPTRHLVPSAGHRPAPVTPVWRDFAVVGPMARRVEDLELLLPILAGGALRPPGDAAGLRIAAYEDDGLGPVAAPCRAAARAAASALADAGHDVVEERPPSTAEVRARYDALMAAELRAFHAGPLAGRVELLGDRVRDMFAAAARARPPSLGDYLEAQARLTELERETDAWLERTPVAICPAGPVAAFPVGQRVTEVEGEPTHPAGLLTLCTYANALGLPAVSVPVNPGGDGEPVGVQVLGRRGHDLQVLAVARQVEAALGGWSDPP